MNWNGFEVIESGLYCEGGKRIGEMKNDKVYKIFNPFDIFTIKTSKLK